MSPLAAGGMARIYIARTTGIGAFERHVVLKLITPERANDAVAVQMFLDEARLAASLNHQNVAQVFEVGEDGGIHYLAMEYVHGQDLRALLAKAGGQGTRVPSELALTVVAGAAAGLHHAHERRGPDGTPLGIVHRDVSPSNIMIGYDGSVKLLDFGIAKAAARSVETQSGIIKGKFAYMAPEQCRGRDVDRRSDVFSLGIILYEITTQHRCFRADSDFDTMHRIVTGDVVRPMRLIQGYPQALEAIVMKALAVDANQRYQSAGQLLEAIEAYGVSARMSLSTMALGRFMRDMFGDTPEPWLTNPGHASAAAIPPQKESTISNTNGGQPAATRASTATSPETPDAHMQARTVLELPRGRDDHGDDHDHDHDREEPNDGEWNPKPYAPAPSAYAAAPAVPPGNDMRRSSTLMKAVAPAPLIPAPLAAPASAPLAPLAPALIPPMPSKALGTQPPPPTSAAAIATAAGTASLMPAAELEQDPDMEDSGPLLATTVLPSSRLGYGDTGHTNLPYPLYEPPEDSADSADDVRLKPTRRTLVIGAAIILIALAVVIAMTIGGSGGNVGTGGGSSALPNAAARSGEVGQQPAEAQGGPPAQAAAGADAAPAGADANSTAADVAADESIGIKVVSDPDGADVLLSGKSIGTTPLETKIKKGTGQAYLTVHRAGYHDVTTLIDLTGDFSKEVVLKKVGDKDDEKKKPEDDRKKPDKLLEAKRAEELRRAEELKRQRAEELRRAEELKKQQEAKKPKCQPPGQINPFDTSCLGMPGASPSGACPPCKDFK